MAVKDSKTERYEEELRKARRKAELEERKILDDQELHIAKLRGLTDEDNESDSDYDPDDEDSSQGGTEEQRASRFQRRAQKLREEARQKLKEEAAKELRQAAKRAWQGARTGAAAGEAAGTAAAGAAGTAGTAVAGAETAGAAAATSEIWVPILIGLAILLGLVILFVMIFVSIKYVCDEYGVNLPGIGYTGILPASICEAIGSGAAGGGPSGGAGANRSFCTPDQNVALAKQYNVPATPTNDPQLTSLISCIQASGLSVGSIATYENSNPSCNYTRGNDVCGACAHSVNSCHYGGSTGTQGAQSVDFGGMPGTGNEGTIGPLILQAAQACNIPLKRAACENSTGNAVACASPSASHIHITLATCDADNGPINTQ